MQNEDRWDSSTVSMVVCLPLPFPELTLKSPPIQWTHSKITTELQTTTMHFTILSLKTFKYQELSNQYLLNIWIYYFPKHKKIHE